MSTAWGLSWSYDGFGNRLNQNVTKGMAPSMATLVDANTNRLSGFGYSYDNNGNLLTMPQQSASMAYDASNRMVTFTNQNDTESYQYAPDNKRVWRSNACQDGQGAKHPSFYYYSVFGQLLGEYCTISGSVTVKQENFHFGGRIVAKGDPPGAITSLTTDRLHSKGDGSTFFPYGETKSGAPITGDSFATYSRDWTGLDYADQRWYAPGVGRFTTVDPDSNRSLVRKRLNLYDYTDGDSVNYIDPMGSFPIFVSVYVCFEYENRVRKEDGDGWTTERTLKCFYGHMEVLPTADVPVLVPGPGIPAVQALIDECKTEAQKAWQENNSNLLKAYIEEVDKATESIRTTFAAGSLSTIGNPFNMGLNVLVHAHLFHVATRDINIRYDKIIQSDGEFLASMLQNCEAVYMSQLQ